MRVAKRGEEDDDDEDEDVDEAGNVFSYSKSRGQRGRVAQR